MADLFDRVPQEYITLVNDINSCLLTNRVDKMMFLFLHIYHQIDENYHDQNDFKLLHARINKALRNKMLMSLIELYYKVSEGDEGRLLFDPSITDEPIYDLTNYAVQESKEKVIDVFEFMIDMRRMIAINLGRLKRMMLSGSTDLPSMADL